MHKNTAVAIPLVKAAAFFAKAFNAEAGDALAAEVAERTGGLAGRRVVIIDHPPTAGLVPLIEGLEAQGAEVHLRDHHGDNPRDAATVAACREKLGSRAVISTRAANPACAELIELGEFAGDVIVADADQDGVTAALKAAGVTYPELEADAAVLDGPVSGKTEEALSPLGFLFVRAWGALPNFGAPGREKVFAEIVSAFAEAAGAEGEEDRYLGLAEYAVIDAAEEIGDAPHREGAEEEVRAPYISRANVAREMSSRAKARLELLAEEYERKAGVAKTLAERIEEVVPGLRLLNVRGAPAYDQPTLTRLLDERGALVTVTVKGDGPIAKMCGGTQVSLARTKAGEQAGVDLAKLVPEDWARGPAEGVISNTPFLLHLSEEKWEQIRDVIVAAVAPPPCGRPDVHASGGCECHGYNP